MHGWQSGSRACLGSLSDPFEVSDTMFPGGVEPGDRLEVSVELRLGPLTWEGPPIELVPNTPAPPASVPYQLENLDSLFTVSLVVNFK